MREWMNSLRTTLIKLMIIYKFLKAYKKSYRVKYIKKCELSKEKKHG